MSGSTRVFISRPALKPVAAAKSETLAEFGCPRYVPEPTQVFYTCQALSGFRCLSPRFSARPPIQLAVLIVVPCKTCYHEFWFSGKFESIRVLRPRVGPTRQPVRRRVALKIIKLGMDTRQSLHRFGTS